MTALLTAGQVGGAAYIAAAWAFIIAVFGGALVVRAARARGKRLFVDKPNEVLSHLKQDNTHQHDWDGFQ
jgi:hypothetical protein